MHQNVKRLSLNGWIFFFFNHSGLVFVVLDSLPGDHYFSNYNNNKKNCYNFASHDSD